MHIQQSGSGSHQEAWARNEQIKFRITASDACMLETGYHGAQVGLELDM